MKYLLTLILLAGCSSLEEQDLTRELALRLNKIPSKHEFRKEVMSHLNELDIVFIEKEKIDFKWDILLRLRSMGGQAATNGKACIENLDILKEFPAYDNPTIKQMLTSHIELCNYYSSFAKGLDLLIHKVKLAHRRHKAIKKRNEKIRNQIKKAMQKRFQIAI